MLTVQDAIELRDLRREFEEATLMSEAFPKNKYFKKRVELLELMICNIESDNRRM